MQRGEIRERTGEKELIRDVKMGKGRVGRVAGPYFERSFDAFTSVAGWSSQKRTCHSLSFPFRVASMGVASIHLPPSLSVLLLVVSIRSFAVRFHINFLFSAVLAFVSLIHHTSQFTRHLYASGSYRNRRGSPIRFLILRIWV